MTGSIFFILCGINFLLCPSEGKITAPPKGKNFTFLPRSTERITWAFDDDEGDLVSRTWTFSSSDGSKPEILAAIYGKTNFDIRNSSLPGTSIEPPATLVLKDVDLSYNGTYVFAVQALATDTREVTVYIAVAPTVTLCSSSITVNESETITCLCTGQGGNPPATVTWYKNGKQIGGVGKEENLLNIRNVKKTDNGTYQCVAESHPSEKVEKSVVVTVNYSPKDVTVKISPNPVLLDTEVVISCEADGVPKPNYTIFHNGTVFFQKKTYTIPHVRYSDGGPYKCLANNKVGNASSETKNLRVRTIKSPEGSTTIAASTTIITPSSTTIAGGGGDTGSPGGGSGHGGGGLGIGEIVGIVIGLLALLLVIMIFLWWRKNKRKAGYGGSANVNPGDSDNARLGGRGDNTYESVNDGPKAGGDNARGSTSGNPPGDAKPPVVYATVDKNRKNEPSVTYATLDTMAMQPNGSKRENEPPRAQTEYASINFQDMKGDLV